MSLGGGRLSVPTDFPRPSGRPCARGHRRRRLDGPRRRRRVQAGEWWARAHRRDGGLFGAVGWTDDLTIWSPVRTRKRRRYRVPVKDGPRAAVPSTVAQRAKPLFSALGGDDVGRVDPMGDSVTLLDSRAATLSETGQMVRRQPLRALDSRRLSAYHRASASGSASSALSKPGDVVGALSSSARRGSVRASP